MLSSFVSWNMDPVLLEIGNFTLRWYSVLMATGFVLGYLVIRRMFINEGIPLAVLESFGIYIVLGMFIGGRLVHCLFYEPGHYLQFPLDIIKPWRGELGNGAVFTGFRGMASHGGVAGVIVGLSLNARKKKLPILWVFDRFAIVLALAGTFIRLGNLFNSEILGTRTSIPWAFIFERVSTVPKHPVQLYEALAYLTIFLITYWYYRAYHQRIRNGEILSIALILVFLSRFFFEFIKEGQTSSDSFALLKMGQWLSIPFILAGIALFTYMKIQHVK